MPNGQTPARPQRTEIIAIAAAVGLGGVALILLGLKGKAGIGGLAPLGPGEFMGSPASAFLEGTGVITVPVMGAIAATRPQVQYSGPGRDAYTYFRIVQNQGGRAVTVYGSGVAGVHVGPANTPTTFDLVSPSQPEPPGCPAQALCAYPWPGVLPTPICGGPPRPGPADAVLEVYERRTAADADGFSSPTCNGRVPVARKLYPNKVLFP